MVLTVTKRTDKVIFGQVEDRWKKYIFITHARISDAS